MSNPEEAIIEQAIGTLHELMKVLTNLDDNLRALSQDVYEAELAHEAKSAENVHRQSTTEEVDTTEPVGESTTSNEAGRKSVRRSTIRKSQINQPSKSNSNAPVNAGAATGRPSVRKSTIRKSQINQPRESNLDAPVDAGAATGRPSVRKSVIRVSQTLGSDENQANSDQPTSMENTDTNDPDTPVDDDKTERKSVRSSVRKSKIQLPEERVSKIISSARSSIFQNDSERQSEMADKSPSEEETSSSIPQSSSEAPKRDITGRLTMFLGQFDSYVNEIAGKIEGLNDRVEALGCKDSDNDGQS